MLRKCLQRLWGLQRPGPTGPLGWWRNSHFIATQGNWGRLETCPTCWLGSKKQQKGQPKCRGSQSCRHKPQVASPVLLPSKGPQLVKEASLTAWLHGIRTPRSHLCCGCKRKCGSVVHLSNPSGQRASDVPAGKVISASRGGLPKGLKVGVLRTWCPSCLFLVWQN